MWISREEYESLKQNRSCSKQSDDKFDSLVEQIVRNPDKIFYTSSRTGDIYMMSHSKLSDFTQLILDAEQQRDEYLLQLRATSAELEWYKTKYYDLKRRAVQGPDFEEGWLL